MVLNDIIYTLEAFNVTDVLLPFALVFTIIFAVLKKSKVMGDDSHKFNVIIALIMGLAVIIPHTLGLYGKPSVVDIINASLPQISLFTVIGVMFLLMVGVFAKDVNFAHTSLGGIAVLLSIIAVVLIFGSSAGWFMMPGFLAFLMNPQVKSFIVTILVFGIIIAFVTGDHAHKEKKVGRNFGKVFTEFMK